MGRTLLVELLACAELDGVHGIGVFAQQSIGVGDEACVQGVVGRERPGGVGRRGQDAVVLRCYEFERSVDEVAEVVQEDVVVRRHLVRG